MDIAQMGNGITGWALTRKYFRVYWLETGYERDLDMQGVAALDLACLDDEVIIELMVVLMELGCEL